MSIKDQHLRESMPPTYIKLFLQHAASEGLSATQILTGTHLDAEDLLHGNPRVSFAETRQVLTNMTRIMGPGWHLALARRLTISSHGPLGFAVVTASDMRHAVDVLLRFFAIRAPFLWLAGAIEGNEFVIRLYEAVPLDEQRNELLELALLAMQRLLERPLGRKIRSAHIALAYSAPDYSVRLKRDFHAGLEFNAGAHMLRFPVSWLDEPCVLHDEAMHRYLLLRCEEDLHSAMGMLPAEIAIRQALLARAETIPGLKEIAAGQNVSPRTLIRRLKRAGTSYNAIREDVRKTRATDYLLHSDFNVTSIAYRLGYKDPSNFGRAFRGWFGLSPGRYRDQAKGSGRDQEPAR
jgi:AraC-like DNA-binding protein